MVVRNAWFTKRNKTNDLSFGTCSTQGEYILARNEARELVKDM